MFSSSISFTLISDWLRDSSLSGPHGVNLEAGHSALGKDCAGEVLGQQILGGSSRPWDPYILKYTVRHLTKAGQQASPLLDQGMMMDLQSRRRWSREFMIKRAMADFCCSAIITLKHSGWSETS